MTIDTTYAPKVLLDIVSRDTGRLLTCHVWDVSRSVSRVVTMPPEWREIRGTYNQVVYKYDHVTLSVFYVERLKNHIL